MTKRNDIKKHLDAFNDAFKTKLVDDISRFTKLWFLTQYEKQQYDKGKGIVKWQARQKQKPTKLLVDTGRLKNSIRVYNKTTDSFRIATSVPYAHYHNEGTQNIPARPFLYQSNELDRQVEKLIEEKLNKLFNVR